MVNLGANVTNVSPSRMPFNKTDKIGKDSVGETFKKCLEDINSTNQQADNSVTNLLSGKSQDINTVIAEVAKADMSFKLLVGVRNKIVEAYKQTMQMQL